jgi:GrpB-like predicted nucleotidyltransferase (UPF0157 family)
MIREPSARIGNRHMPQFRDERTPANEEYLRACTIGELTPLAAPIILVEYDSHWPARFQHEAERICSALGEQALRVEHVGSTSVPGLTAKPIIDILLVVADSANETEYVPALQTAGYALRIRESGWHQHRMLKGAEADVNLHVFSVGCPEIERMVSFRDWLRTSAEDRDFYARFKRDLAQNEWKYTQNYADAKTAVIGQIMYTARRAAR